MSYFWCDYFVIGVLEQFFAIVISWPLVVYKNFSIFCAFFSSVSNFLKNVFFFKICFKVSKTYDRKGEFIIAYRNSKKVSKYRILVYEIVKFLNEILLVEFHFHSMFVCRFINFYTISLFLLIRRSFSNIFNIL